MVTAPATCAIVEKSDRPEAWRVFSNTEKKIIPNDSVQHMRIYSSAISAISAFFVCEPTYAPVPNIPNSRNTTYITAARNIAFPAALPASSRSPWPRLRDISAFIPTPVPMAIATISICTGKASVSAFRACSPPSAMLDTNALSTML